MTQWETLAGSDQRRALVIGNGPSRRTAEAVEFASEWDGSTIACNAYWREVAPDAAPDWTCCLDAEQVNAAAAWAFPPDAAPPRTRDGRLARLAVPQRGAFAGARDESMLESLGPMVTEFPPHDVSAGEHSMVDPATTTIGAFAGHAAFQLALHLGAREVYLLGMDGSGTMQPDGRVQLSAVPSTTPGYEGIDAPREFCDALPDGTWRPRGWRSAVAVWRALVRAAELRGVRVRRVLPVGALDFVRSRS